jgi:predicted transcriptional regulator of viral defense system
MNVSTSNAAVVSAVQTAIELLESDLAVASEMHYCGGIRDYITDAAEEFLWERDLEVSARELQSVITARMVYARALCEAAAQADMAAGRRDKRGYLVG